MTSPARRSATRSSTTTSTAPGSSSRPTRRRSPTGSASGGSSGFERPVAGGRGPRHRDLRGDRPRPLGGLGRRGERLAAHLLARGRRGGRPAGDPACPRRARPTSRAPSSTLLDGLILPRRVRPRPGLYGARAGPRHDRRQRRARRFEIALLGAAIERGAAGAGDLPGHADAQRRPRRHARAAPPRPSGVPHAHSRRLQRPRGRASSPPRAIAAIEGERADQGALPPPSGDPPARRGAAGHRLVGRRRRGRGDRAARSRASYWGSCGIPRRRSAAPWSPASSRRRERSARRDTRRCSDDRRDRAGDRRGDGAGAARRRGRDGRRRCARRGRRSPPGARLTPERALGAAARPRRRRRGPQRRSWRLLEARNAGKPIGDARGEIGMVADTFRYYAAAPQRLLGDTIPVSGGVDMTFREPLGVVGLIVPWNFPLTIAAWKLGPGARGRQHGRPQAGGADAADRARARAHRPRGRVSPRASSTSSPARGASAASASSSTPTWPRSPSPGSTAVGRADRRGRGGDDQARDARARRQVGERDLRRRRPRGRSGRRAPMAVFGNAGQDCCARSRILVERSVLDRFLELTGGRRCGQSGSAIRSTRRRRWDR